VGGNMDIGVRELLVLLAAFSVPIGVGAWVLRR
jgi:hypothetical protein